MTWGEIVTKAIGAAELVLSAVPLPDTAKLVVKATLAGAKASLFVILHPDVVLTGAADGQPAVLKDNR
jgi:hypothetical protein